MSNPIKFKIMSTILILVLFLVSCSPASIGEPTTISSDEQSPEVKPSITPEKKLILGANFEAIDNPFFQSMKGYMEDISKELGFELVTTSADGKADKQITDIENFIASGVDGMIVAPISEANGVKIIELAEEAEIPLVIMCGWPGFGPGERDYNYYIAHAMAGDTKPGVSMGYDLAMTLINAGAKKIVAINGPHGHSASEERYEGLIKAISENPDVELVAEEWGSWTREPAMTAMENFLAAYPVGEIDGVFAYNDGAAMGAIQALKNAGRLSEVLVGGMDSTPEAIEAIKNGEMLASVGGHWIVGGFGLIVLYDYLNGYEPIVKKLPVTAATMTVSSDNVKVWEDQFLNQTPPLDIRAMSRTTNPSSTEDFTFKIILNSDGYEIERR